MSRPLVALIAILLVVIGALVLLSMKSSERAPVRVEKVVPLGNLQ
ncbi:MAG: hypothetical protein V4659_00730 [Pseudomonadota bacterium]